jgi:hypothetical protein
MFVDFIIPYMQDLASKAHRGIGFVTYEHSGTLGVLLNFLSLLYMGQITKSWGTKRELLITFPIVRAGNIQFTSRATLV